MCPLPELRCLDGLKISLAAKLCVQQPEHIQRRFEILFLESVDSQGLYAHFPPGIGHKDGTGDQFADRPLTDDI